jgi:hypothetical protein
MDRLDHHTHMQHMDNLRQESLRKYPEHENRQIIFKQWRAPQLSIWRVIRAWFVARRQSLSYEETYHKLMRLLHPRKAKVVQNVHETL